MGVGSGGVWELVHVVGNGAVRGALGRSGLEWAAPVRGCLMEAKLKHLELVQGVVSRMAFNSFMLKGWTVVLVSAVLVLEGGSRWALVGLVPTLVFWGLDGYFLRQERLYRALYDHVRLLEPDKIDFSMSTSPFKGPGLTWTSSAFSVTLLLFYMAIAVGIALAGLLGGGHVG